MAGVARLGQYLLDGVVHVPAALGDTAGTEADADFAQLAVWGHRLGTARRGALGLLPGKIVQYVGDHRGGEPPIGDAVDLHHGGQRAAAQAGHLLDREESLGVRVVARGDFQAALECVLDQLRAFDVTGCAVADIDDMAADRAMPELGIKRRHAHNRRRRDIGQLANPLDRLGRHVAIVRLDRLQDRDHDLAAAAQPLDGLIDKGEIEVRHSIAKPQAAIYRGRTSSFCRADKSVRPGRRDWPYTPRPDRPRPPACTFAA